MTQNPFTYGNPITNPARFIGRRREIEQVQSRLLNAEFESSSIVGERRIGKTSLLKYLSHPDVVRKAGFPAELYIFVYVDLQIFDPAKSPTDFWRRVLQAIKRLIDDDEVQRMMDDVSQVEPIDTFILDDLFTFVDDANLHIVLLLDEFERVTQNKNFDVDFFSGMRAMAIHHNLALITCSRRELVELTHSKEVQDSPFFNIFANVNLRPLQADEVETLIETYLAGNEISFEMRDIDYIFEIAGCHPYFVQMACFFLHEAYQAEQDARLRRRLLNTEFREKAAPMFRDYWSHSSADQQVLLTVMSLQHLWRGGGLGGGDTIDQLKQFHGGTERVLLALEKRGMVLADSADTERYRPFSIVFCDWVADELVAGTGDEAIWGAWQIEQASRLDKLPDQSRQRVLNLLPRLNSQYADSLGDWLLNPSVIRRAAPLLENFLGSYHQYLSSRPIAPVAGLSPTLGDTSESDSFSTQDRSRLQSLRQQLVTYNRNLNRLEEQAAEHGVLGVPTQLQSEIEATRNKIEEIKQELAALGGN